MTETPGKVSELTTLYLQSHEGGATAGTQFFRRVANSHHDRPWGDEVMRLSREVFADLHSLRRLMRKLDVPRNVLLDVTLQAAELAGRLKPNGRILRRSPLTDLVEVEGLLDAVHAKAVGWQTLLAADPARYAEDVQPLADRAADQLDRLVEIHRTVAATVLD